ncbi:DUF1127 domain-containing protein [Aestuariibius sp. HNIBRBA575]|uniref:DUF1127 domain-containing protein n=1 Tax=Aestuariibius sp. HNIBRBA575 TaxID=3233343 RepID=UPI0034A138A3
MAATDTHTAHISIFDILTAPFRAIGNAIMYLSENNSRVKEVERLQNLSDDKLAKMGLERSDIVAHVFRAHMYI